MATNRQINFSIRVANASTGTLRQIGRSFRDIAKDAKDASAAIKQVNTQTGVLKTTLTQLRSSAASIRGVAQALNTLKAGGNQSFGQLTTSIKNFNNALRSTSTLTNFTRILNNATRAATNFNTIVQQTVTQLGQLGAVQNVQVRFAAAAAGATNLGSRAAAVTPQIKNMGQTVATTSAFVTRFKEDMTEAAAAVALVHGPLGGVASRLTALGTLLSTAGLRAGIMILALSGLAVASFKAVTASGELERQQRRIASTLRTTGGVSGQTADSIEELVDKYARLTDLDDTPLREAANELLFFRSVTKDTFERVFSDAQDLASSGLLNLEQSVKALGKAMQDPIAGLDTLRKAGINFTESEQIAIRDAVILGKKLEAQQIILSKVERSYKGLAAASGNTLAGALNHLGVAIGNVFENLGKESGLLENTITAINHLADGINYLADNMKNIIPVIRTFTALTGTLLTFKVLPYIFRLLGASATGAASPITALANGLRNYGLAAQIASAQGKTVGSVLLNMTAAASGIGPPMVNLAATTNSLGSSFRKLGILGSISTLMRGLGRSVLFLINPLKLIPGLLNVIRTGLALLAANPFGALIAGLTTLIGLVAYYKDAQIKAFGETFRVIDYAAVVWEDFVDTVQTAITASLEYISTFPDYIASALQGVVVFFRTVFGSIINITKSTVNVLIGLWRIMFDAILAALQLVAKNWETFLDNLSKKVSAVGDALYETFVNFDPKKGLQSFQRALKVGLIDNFKNTFSGFQEQIQVALTTDYVGGVSKIIKDYAGEVGAEFSGILDGLNKKLEEYSKRAGARFRKAQEEAKKTEQTQIVDPTADFDTDKLTEFLDGLDKSTEGLQKQLVLQNQFGRKQELINHLIDIAIEAQNTGLLNSKEAMAKIVAKMETYKKLWEEVDKLNRGQVGMIRGIKAAFAEFIDDATNDFENFKSLTTGFIDKLTDQWVEFTQTGRFNFKEMLDSMAADIARFAFRRSLATLFEGIGLGGDSDFSIAEIFGLASKTKGSTDNAKAEALLQASRRIPMLVDVHNVAEIAAIIPAGSTSVTAPFIPSQTQRSEPLVFPTQGARVEAAAASLGSQTARAEAQATVRLDPESLTKITIPVVKAVGTIPDQLTDGLTQLGLKPHQVAGVLGALSTETNNFDPRAVNPTSGALGVGQVLGPRLDELVLEAQKSRKSIYDGNLQVNNMLRELSTTEKSSLAALRKTSTSSEAAEVFLKQFQRPSADELRKALPLAKERARDIEWNFGKVSLLSGGGGTNTLSGANLSDVLSTNVEDATSLASKLSSLVNNIVPATQDVFNKATDRLSAAFDDSGTKMSEFLDEISASLPSAKLHEISAEASKSLDAQAQFFMDMGDDFSTSAGDFSTQLQNAISGSNAQYVAAFNNVAANYQDRLTQDIETTVFDFDPVSQKLVEQATTAVGTTGDKFQDRLVQAADAAVFDFDPVTQRLVQTASDSFQTSTDAFQQRLVEQANTTVFNFDPVSQKLVQQTSVAVDKLYDPLSSISTTLGTAGQDFNQQVAAHFDAAGQDFGADLSASVDTYISKIDQSNTAAAQQVQSSVTSLGNTWQTLAQAGPLDSVSANIQYAAERVRVAGDSLGTNLQSATTRATQSVQSFGDAVEYVYPEAYNATDAFAGLATQSQIAAANTSTLGSSSSTSAGQVSELGSSASTAGTSLKTAGGTNSSGFGGLFSTILGQLGGLVKGIGGQLLSLIQPFISFLGGIGSGGGLLGGLFHDGWDGHSAPKAVQLVAKSKIATASRYHTGYGLKPDEINAILQKDEIVISKKQVAELRADELKRHQASYADMVGDELYGRRSYGPANTRRDNWGPRGNTYISVKQNVVAPNPAAFNESSGQIARKYMSVTRRLAQRNS